MRKMFNRPEGEADDDKDTTKETQTEGDGGTREGSDK